MSCTSSIPVRLFFKYTLRQSETSEYFIDHIYKIEWQPFHFAFRGRAIGRFRLELPPEPMLNPLVAATAVTNE